MAEAMLQQTQVTTVMPYYRRFLRRLPSVKALAESNEHEVLKLWEGLGYYGRARNLRRAAQKIRRDFKGRFPRSAGGLRSLPGVGRYSAGAILSIAMGQDAPAVDGNVTRVFARLLNYDGDVGRTRAKNLFWEMAERLLPRGRAGDFNQALMDLGATVCRPRGPLCAKCPLRRVCRAFGAGTQNELPRKARRAPVPHYDIGAGIVWKDGRVLIARRPSAGLLGGLWEFPGGKRQGRESLGACVRREVKEELGVAAAVGSHLMTVKHAYSHFKVTLHFYQCRYESGRPKALGCAAWRWVEPKNLRRYAFPSGSLPAVKAIATAGAK